MRDIILKLAKYAKDDDDAYKMLFNIIDKHFKAAGGKIDNDFINIDVDELESLVNPDKVYSDVDINDFRLEFEDGRLPEEIN